MVTLILKPEVSDKKKRLKELAELVKTKDGNNADNLKEMKALQPLAALRPEIDVREYQVPGYISKTGAYMLPAQAEETAATESAMKLAENAVQAAITDLGLVTRDELDAAVQAAVAKALAAKGAAAGK